MEQQIEVLLHGGQFKQLLEHRVLAIREKYGLRRVDIEILYYLANCGERDTSKDIREKMKLTKGHISQSVDRLLRMNFLNCRPDSHDRRCVHFSLTEKADEVVQEIGCAWRDLNGIIFSGVTDEERKILLQVAVKMGKNMDSALHGSYVKKT